MCWILMLLDVALGVRGHEVQCLQVGLFTWYSGKETCLESQSSMFESDHGYSFLGMKAYFYL